VLGGRPPPCADEQRSAREIIDFLADFGGSLVVEVPHRDDSMTSRLLARRRTGLFERYDIPTRERELDRRFVVRERTGLPSGFRTLYRCDPGRRRMLEINVVPGTSGAGESSTLLPTVLATWRPREWAHEALVRKNPCS
jgi:hypothetical protein